MILHTTVSQIALSSASVLMAAVTGAISGAAMEESKNATASHTVDIMKYILLDIDITKGY